jgi:hypothetical protein
LLLSIPHCIPIMNLDFIAYPMEPLKGNLVPLWRLDPSESFSDWKLEIETVDDGSVETYHVHRNLMSIGERKSGHLESLFKNNAFAENETHAVRVQFASSAAAAVPVMLDYIYGSNAPLRFSPDTAVAICELGRYFIVPSLCEQAKQFWRTNMTLNNCHLYYTQACIYQNDDVLDCVEEGCVNALINYQDYIVTDRFSHLLPHFAVDFWAGIFDSPAFRHRVLGCKVSLLVLQICQRGGVDGADFDKLTSIKCLPYVDWKVAIPLLKLESELDSNGADPSVDRFSSLQHRCADAFAHAAQNREYVTYITEPENLSYLKRDHPDLFGLVYVKELTTGSLGQSADGLRSFGSGTHSYGPFSFGNHPSGFTTFETHPFGRSLSGEPLAGGFGGPSAGGFGGPPDGAFGGSLLQARPGLFGADSSVEAFGGPGPGLFGNAPHVQAFGGSPSVGIPFGFLPPAAFGQPDHAFGAHGDAQVARVARDATPLRRQRSLRRPR